jgi:pimeloyl-ACP methyl ester carboxylesterase
MERRDSTLRINGLDLYVTEWGPAKVWPLVALHGIRGYGETFAGIAQALQPEFRTIALDQRGRGESAWDPQCRYYTSAYVADLESLVNTLGLAQFDLLGHSMGGINAIVYAARHPDRVRRLVIEDAGPGAFESSPGASRIRRELSNTPDQFASWDAALDFMRALRPTVSEEAREQRLRKMLKPMAGGGFTWRYDHAGITATRLNPDPNTVVDLRPAVQAIQCPTLVLRGGRSDYLQAEMVASMAAANPHISSMEIADAGHYVHDDQPAQVHDALRRFLLPTPD